VGSPTGGGPGTWPMDPLNPALFYFFILSVKYVVFRRLYGSTFDVYLFLKSKIRASLIYWQRGGRWSMLQLSDVTRWRGMMVYPAWRHDVTSWRDIVKWRHDVTPRGMMVYPAWRHDVTSWCEVMTWRRNVTSWHMTSWRDIVKWRHDMTSRFMMVYPPWRRKMYWSTRHRALSITTS